MKLPADFRDVLVCMSDAGVEFLLIGGFAVAHHGHVRATKDIDIFVHATAENAARVIRAMQSFGAPLGALGVQEADFALPGRVVQLGVPPLRIDLVTSISGIEFAQAAESPSLIEVEGRRIPVISLEALLRNKRASARPQDLVDVAALEKVRSL